MREEYTNGELGLMIQNLTKEVQAGFKGVHDRQDKTNGKVKDNCGDIETIQGWKNKMMGAIIIMNIILVPVVLTVIGIFIKKIVL